MTKHELNTRLAADVMSLEPCLDGWRKVWYNDLGAALIRDVSRCQHREGKCYSKVELNTFIGRLGGVPAYCESSQASLVLLAELKRKVSTVVLCGQSGSWTLELYNWSFPLEAGVGPVRVGGPVPAPTAEMAIALTAADLVGLKLTAGDITG